MIAICLGISGALAGMAGLFELTGPAGKLTTTFPVGYGFTAIIVAFLGRLHPIGILFAGLLLAITYVGGDIIQSQLSLPKASIQVFQGMLLFFLLAVDILVNFKIRVGKGISK
jgi:simple sugar transport system permease protein